ncbi:MAG: hypothetical protein LH650_13095 [Chloroflexi bacterium]|nr:hypothetical protein [Chloroflexota bacterium]
MTGRKPKPPQPRHGLLKALMCCPLVIHLDDPRFLGAVSLQLGVVLATCLTNTPDEDVQAALARLDDPTALFTIAIADRRASFDLGGVHLAGFVGEASPRYALRDERQDPAWDPDDE